MHFIMPFLFNFQLQNVENCMYDYLKIYDGQTTNSTLIGHFCGSKTPDKLTSSGSKLLVVFHSDESIEKKGFKFNYTESHGNYIL